METTEIEKKLLELKGDFKAAMEKIRLLDHKVTELQDKQKSHEYDLDAHKD